jgi:hypothetical protein
MVQDPDFLINSGGGHAVAGSRCLRLKTPDPDRSRIPARPSLPAGLQEEALLRVHDLGLFRVDAEEGRVEHVDVVEDAPRANVGRVFPFLRGDAGVEGFGAEEGDALLAVAEVSPELLDRPGPGKAPGHGDDGDAVQAVAGAGEALLALPQGLLQAFAAVAVGKVGRDARGRRGLKELDRGNRLADEVPKPVNGLQG